MEGSINQKYAVVVMLINKNYKNEYELVLGDKEILELPYTPFSALICDLVYNPLHTPFLHAARGVGARTLSGLPMLIYQGASAFRLWTGLEPPVETMFKAALSHLE